MAARTKLELCNYHPNVTSDAIREGLLVGAPQVVLSVYISSSKAIQLRAPKIGSQVFGAPSNSRPAIASAHLEGTCAMW